MLVRSRRRALAAAASAALALTAAGTVTMQMAQATPAARHARTLTGSFVDGSTYLIDVPKHWNGTLFLYSHGYVAPGSANPAQDVSDPLTKRWLLGHHYALAGSSYAITGWSVQSALIDQIRTLTAFGHRVGHPTRTIAWGGSLGGMITEGLIQTHQHRFAGALPLCGVGSGGVGVWNTQLDAAFAFRRLLAPTVQITGITDPASNLQTAETSAAQAQQTAAGRARLALVAALDDQPGWFTTGSPEPAKTAYAEQEANQYAWESQVTFPFGFAFRAQLESIAGGNPSFNTGVNYVRQLNRSVDAKEVRALYRAAGLNLKADLTTLNRTPRISADGGALDYLTQNITYSGRIDVPVLTIHTTGDGLVVPENESAYRRAVTRAHDGRLLRQVYVHRAGHCAFTPAEIVTGLKQIVHRVGSGHWTDASLRPASLDTQARRLGRTYNVISSGDKTVATRAAFTRFRPAPFLRPFDKH